MSKRVGPVVKTRFTDLRRALKRSAVSHALITLPQLGRAFEAIGAELFPSELDVIQDTFVLDNKGTLDFNEVLRSILA